MPIPHFDPIAHRYTDENGKPLPSVTNVLIRAGLIDTSHYNEWNRELGTAVHKAVHLYVKDDLDDSTLDDAVRPYLEAYKRFMVESKADFTANGSEMSLYHDVYRYAGTPDLFGSLNGPAVVDIKTGSPERWHELQSAAYSELLTCKFLREEKEKIPFHRFGLYLHNDGTYTLKEHTNRKDRDVFLAALAVYNWKG